MQKDIGNRLKVFSAIAKAVSDHSVDTMFGLAGDANLYMIDSFVRDYSGNFVAAANEAGAVLMAIGYSQAAGKIGVATVTHGPGLTNTITGIIEGVKSGVPIVLLCGDTPVEDLQHIQRADQRALMTATGAGFEQIRTPQSLSRDIAVAFRRAAVERRPIVVNMPIDFQWLDVDYEKITFQIPEYRSAIPESPDLDDAVGIIAAAKRPIVLAGRGAIHPDARDAIVRLAARIGAPLATTLRGSGLFRGDDYNLGVFGTLSNPLAAEIITESDCIIAFGASLNKYTTAQGGLLKGKRVIHVDIDRGSVGKHYYCDAGLVGDARRTAETILHWIDEAEISSSGFRDNDLKRRIAEQSPQPRLAGKTKAGTVDIRQALLLLDSMIPRDRILVTDVGRFVLEAWPAFQVEHPQSFVYTASFGAIGCGMAQAIGAAAGAAGRPVVHISGDGGFMLGGISEFNTAVRHKSDLITIICNDGSYGAEYIQFRNKQMDPSISLLDWPDFAPVAQALGGDGVTVRSLADMDAVANAIDTRNRPLLIDIKFDPASIEYHR